jgi:mono/diheme cytochrome c family protein
MRAITMAITFCLCTAAASAAQGENVSKGEKVYTDQKCALCHSIGDKGNKKGPLDSVASKLSAADVREWIVDANGMAAKTKAQRKPAMKPFTLPKEDVDALVAYLMTLKK